MISEVFLSHASEDKDAFVGPLAEALRARGLSVWYDKFSVKAGDHLREAIDAGLAKSRFAVIVLSEAFFAKRWARMELDALVARHVSGSPGPVGLIPVWYGVDHRRVAAFSPLLAGVAAISGDLGLTVLADQIVALVRADQVSYAPSAPSAPRLTNSRTVHAARRMEALAAALNNVRFLINRGDGSVIRVAVFVPRGDSLVFVASAPSSARNSNALSGPVSSSFAGYALQTGRSVAAPNVRALSPDARFGPKPGNRLRSFLLVPVVDEQRAPVAVISFESHVESYFDDGDRRVEAQMLTGLVAPFVLDIVHEQRT